MTDPSEQARLHDALAAIWTRTRPALLERQAQITQDLTRLDGGPDDARLREAVRFEAHRLAGLLGTLGLPRGTELARAIEHRLADGAPPPDVAQLLTVADELRTVIESRHQ